ncbi:hypothetical protein GRI97_07985 [Altererythrobacter xixiisoli]|uniref:Uncharacterized protein n=1 Tax=Croceibacterium xixiisoli TaxID=1476466 RepID=A0A6I4TS06_9SPHN|nr:hypothetical protein [Croceibacterium xixiisoli]MXO98925.1 hypothetical protein [Croceibacterium xixiisoli]
MAIRKPFFVVPVPLEGLNAGSAALGQPVHNLAREDAVALTWRSEFDGAHWCTGEFGRDQPIDFCAMLAANAQPGTTIRLRLGATSAQVSGAAPFDSGALPFIDPAIVRDDGLYHSHLELPQPIEARWFRIDIAGHVGPFEASTLVLGRRIEPGRFYDRDFQRGVEDLGAAKFTQWGVLNIEPGVTIRTVDFTLAWQTETEIVEMFEPMARQLGTRGMVYLCFDPEPHPYRQAKTYFGVLKKPPFAKGRPKPATFAQDFAIQSVI